jgi:large subunit ribosomal protein L4
MPKVDILNQQGAIVGAIELAADVFGIEPHKQAMFDAVVMQRAAERQGTHDTMNRREVRGGGRKPFKQKGTGRARAGSIRATQWRGGGVVFGPTPRSYAYRLNRKVRRLALRSVLSQKVLDSAIKVVDKLEFETPKTKDFIKVMANLKLEKKTLFVVSYDEMFETAWLSMRNLQNVQLLAVDGVNVYDVMNADAVVFTETAVKEAMEVFA